MSDDVSPDTNMTGITDRYELLDELGRGGFGVVYKARQKTTGQMVAIKKLLINEKSFVDDKMEAEQKRRFKREMAVIGKLQSPHIVNLVDAGFEDGNPVMVLEYVDGGSLADRLEAEGPLPGSVAIRVMSHVLEGLAEAHDNGIVHRDLKPDNIMLMGKGARTTAKILDFGIAGIELEYRDEVNHETITQFGQIRGTPSYMAPEQFQLFDDPKIQSDIYAAGLILLECMTGRKAVDGESLMAIAHAQLKKPVDIPEPIAVTPVASVIRKACTKEVEGRYGSAEEMLHALQGAVGTGNVDPLTTGRLGGASNYSSETGDLDEVVDANLGNVDTMAADDAEAVVSGALDTPASAASESPAAPQPPARTVNWVVLALFSAVILGGAVFAAMVVTGDKDSRADVTESAEAGSDATAAGSGSEVVPPQSGQTPPLRDRDPTPPEHAETPTTKNGEAADEGTETEAVGDINPVDAALAAADKASTPQAKREALQAGIDVVDEEAPALIRALADLEAGEGNLDAAALMYRSLLQHPDFAADATFALAETKLSQGQKKKAFVLYRAYVEQYPTGPYALQADRAARELKQSRGGKRVKKGKKVNKADKVKGGALIEF